MSEILNSYNDFQLINCSTIRGNKISGKKFKPNYMFFYKCMNNRQKIIVRQQDDKNEYFAHTLTIVLAYNNNMLKLCFKTYIGLYPSPLVVTFLSCVTFEENMKIYY